MLRFAAQKVISNVSATKPVNMMSGIALLEAAGEAAAAAAADRREMNMQMKSGKKGLGGAAEVRSRQGGVGGKNHFTSAMTAAASRSQREATRT
ncbi:hypothetical protein GCM10023213_43970 [Prosthecobacter algae]|uniref:Uncharacterized protein n=1 Tax=Prosthecobacter algae TaxID=1144682 RepID=A0ABP9PLR2_9BACT